MNMRIPDDEEVIVNVPTFVAKVDKLIPQTSKRYVHR